MICNTREYYFKSLIRLIQKRICRIIDPRNVTHHGSLIYSMISTYQRQSFHRVWQNSICKRRYIITVLQLFTRE